MGRGACRVGWVFGAWLVALWVTVAPALAEELSGTVTDRETGPVPGVMVEIQRIDSPGFYDATVTNLNGGYLFTGLPPGNYLVNLPSFFPASGWVAIVTLNGQPQSPLPPMQPPMVPIAPGQPTMVDFPSSNTAGNPNPDRVLGTADGVLGGFLFLDTGAPNLPGLMCNEAWTGTEGGLGGPVTGPFRPGPGQLNVMEPIVPGATVRVTPLSPVGPTTTLTTDATGYWQIPGALPGASAAALEALPDLLMIEADDPSGGTRFSLIEGHEFVLSAPRGNPPTLTGIRMFTKNALPLGCPADVIAGRVVFADPSGGPAQPAPDQTVSLVWTFATRVGFLRQVPPFVVVRTTTTDAMGAFAFSGMPPGLWTVVLGNPADANAPTARRVIRAGPTPLVPITFVLEGTTPTPGGCDLAPACEGALHEVTLSTTVFIGDAPTSLDVKAWMWGRKNGRWTLTDEVQVSTDGGPGAAMGLDGVLSIEGVAVTGDGTAHLTLCATANPEVFPSGAFGDDLRWIVVNVNGTWRFGWARFRAPELRVGAWMAWSDRCGTRTPCGVPDQISPTAPWWCLPQFLVTGNGSHASWLVCNPPPPCPDQSDDGTGGYHEIDLKLRVCASKGASNTVVANFYGGWKRMGHVVLTLDGDTWTGAQSGSRGIATILEAAYQGDHIWCVTVRVRAPAGDDGGPGALPACWSHVTVKVNGRRRQAWWDGDADLDLGPFIGWAGDFLYDVLRYRNAADAVRCASNGG